MKKSPKQIDIKKLAKDIIDIKIDSNLSLHMNFKKFYRVMRKYGIKEGTKTQNGVLRNNHEWTMCMSLFLRGIDDHIVMKHSVFGDTPKDLQY